MDVFPDTIISLWTRNYMVDAFKRNNHVTEPLIFLTAQLYMKKLYRLIGEIFSLENISRMHQ